MFCGALDSLLCATESKQVKVESCSSEEKEITTFQDSFPKKSKPFLPNHKRPRISERDKFESRAKAKKMATMTRMTRSTTNCKTDSVVFPDDFTHEAQVLKTRFPASTVHERKRFLSGRTLDRASEKMQSFMTWREHYHLNDPHLLSISYHNDEQLWNHVVFHTASYYDTKEGSSSKRRICASPIRSCQMLLLPRIVKFGDCHQDFRARDGRRIALVNPALIDISIAPLELYAACIAVYLYLKLDRHSEENIHVLIDVRAGRGWSNPSPTILIPFVKHLSKMLVDYMPERMYACILFPLPVAAKPIWGIFKTFLDRKVVGKMRILFGPASFDSKIPKGMENETIDFELMTQLEKARQADFKSP
jgi:hypothetical protein